MLLSYIILNIFSRQFTCDTKDIASILTQFLYMYLHFGWEVV